MSDLQIRTVAVIGVGLIGGSIALATHENLGAHVRGYDLDQEELQKAQRMGVIDTACSSLEEALEGAQLAFIAVPVGSIVDVVTQALDFALPDCIVTDVGSTKENILSEIDDARFVGGHPLAGSQEGGVEAAQKDLFANAAWYLTPSKTTEEESLELVSNMVKLFGSTPLLIDAATHDRIMAVTSHLPHVLANALVTQARQTLSNYDQLPLEPGPSFRDATRVAGANSAIWIDIYRANRKSLITEIDRLIEQARKEHDRLLGER